MAMEEGVKFLENDPAGNDPYLVYNSTAHTETSMEVSVDHLLYIFVWVGILNCVIFLVGVVGNTMVILVLVKIRDMRTPTNYFLFNLSITDLLVLLICQPSALIEFYAKDRWFMGDIACRMIPMLENAVLHGSVMTILAITLERYYAICHPLRNRLSYSSNCAVKNIVLIWILSYLLALPLVFMTVMEDAQFYDGSPCHVCRTKVYKLWHYWYLVLIFVIFFVLPIFVLIVAYGYIIKKLAVNFQQSGSMMGSAAMDASTMYAHRSRRQVIRMLIAMVVLFFVSLLPMRIVGLWLIFTPVEDISRLGLEANLNLISFARVLMYINSAGNPIIYSMLSTKFKFAFKRILGLYHPRTSNGACTLLSTRPSTRNRNTLKTENTKAASLQLIMR